MGHGHAHGHGHGHGHAHGHGAPATPGTRGRRTLLIVLAMTALFCVAELVVGIATGSLALVADAGHMLNDAGALLVSLFVAQVALMPRSTTKTFGYRRAEVLGAQLNAMALLAVAGGIFVEAIGRFADPPEIAAQGALGTAIAGLVVNLFAAVLLARSAPSGLHVKSALYHVLGDALGSVAAIVSSALVLAVGLRIADPIASLVICVLLAVGALRLLAETTHVLMEGAPAGMDVAAVEQSIAATQGVRSVHDLHVWTLTPGQPMLTAHVVIAPGEHGIEVARRVGQELRDKHGIEHVTIQPEAPEAALVELRIRKG